MKAGGTALHGTLSALVLAAVIVTNVVTLNSVRRLAKEIGQSSAIEQGEPIPVLDPYADGTPACCGIDPPPLVEQSDGACAGRVSIAAEDQSGVRYFPAAAGYVSDDDEDLTAGVSTVEPPLASLPGYVRLADTDVPVQETAKEFAPPEPLSPPVNASPIQADRTARDNAARAIIQDELPNASDEERGIWFENLKDVPPNLIRDLLRIRRQVGAANPFRPMEPQAAPAPRNKGRLFAEGFAPGTSASAQASASALAKLQTAISATNLARDVVLNNIANADTVAFKRARVRLTDLGYDHRTSAGQQDGPGNVAPLGTAVGLGTRVAATELDFQNGSLNETGKPLDLAIVGQGFFRVRDGSRPLYTRAGTFVLNAKGALVLATAERAYPHFAALTIPQDAAEISISAEGIVSALSPGSNQFTQVGQIELVRFANPGGLSQLGDGLYAETEGSGAARAGLPGHEGLGTLRQRHLESSNVDLSQELAELERLTAQLQTLSQAMRIVSPGSQFNSLPDGILTQEAGHEDTARTVIRRQSFNRSEQHRNSASSDWLTNGPDYVKRLFKNIGTPSPPCCCPSDSSVNAECEVTK